METNVAGGIGQSVGTVNGNVRRRRNENAKIAVGPRHGYRVDEIGFPDD